MAKTLITGNNHPAGANIINYLIDYTTDYTNLYRAWLDSTNVIDLIWNRHLNLTTEQQKTLACRWWLYLIFVDFGQISLKVENQLLNYIDKLQSIEFKNILVKYYYNKPDLLNINNNKFIKAEFLKQIGIDHQFSLNNSIFDLMVVDEIDSKHLFDYKQLIAKHGDFNLTRLLKTKTIKPDLAKALCLVSIKRQLNYQLFYLNNLNNIDINYDDNCQPDDKIIVIDLNISKLVKNIKLLLPATFTLPNSSIDKIKNLLLTYWATTRVAWSLLKVKSLNNNQLYLLQMDSTNHINDVRSLIQAMLEQDLVQLLQRSDDCVGLSRILKNDISYGKQQRLYNKINNDQLQLLQNLQQQQPADFNRALTFDNNDAACRVMLTKLTSCIEDKKLLNGLK